jgi:hypothetical protein
MFDFLARLSGGGFDRPLSPSTDCLVTILLCVPATKTLAFTTPLASEVCILFKALPLAPTPREIRRMDA